MVTKGTATKDGALTEQFFGQVSESLQLVFDLTSRIDERVKMIIEKQKSIDEFQNNPKVRVFIGNIISAGSAITLTASDTTIFHDLDFVPANHQQAEDRNFRIGQDKTVNIYYPIFSDTIEERIYETLQRKKEIISTVMGEENKSVDIMEDFITSLIKK